MRKYGLRLLVGVLAFVIGVVAVAAWMISGRVITVRHSLSLEEVESSKEHTKDLDLAFQEVPSGKIEVRFLGYGKIENRPTLRFELINQFSHPVTYISWSEEPNHILKFNGTEVGEFPRYSPCIYTGPEKENVLEAKKSIRIEILADLEFSKWLIEKGSFEFGFLFRNPNEIFGKRYWSELIIIPEKVKKEIIKNAPGFLKPKKSEETVTKTATILLPKGFVPFKNYNFSPTN